jgi:hypothetical protein
MSPVISIAVLPIPKEESEAFRISILTLSLLEVYEGDQNIRHFKFLDEKFHDKDVMAGTETTLLITLLCHICNSVVAHVREYLGDV